jgi:hypothetical protein
MTPRQRAPGGGRKPIGARAKVANFSTRITPDTRAQLDAHAATTGQSVSQVAERMLRLGLEIARAKQIDDPIRALAHLLRLLAKQCRYVDTAFSDEYRDWHNDPFAFDAFARAVQMLVERLRPPGEIKAPEEISPGFPTWPTSEKQAEIAAATVWREVISTPPTRPSELRERINKRGRANEIAEEHGLRLHDWPEELIGRFSSHTHSLEDVRRALGIKMEGKKS